MNSTMPPREDEQVKTAVRNVLLGSAPERESELASLWSLLEPRFQLTADTYDGARLVMEAGMYRFVRFNHRVVRAFWIAGFAAWEAYRVVAETPEFEPLDLKRLAELIDAFERVLESDAPELEALPKDVPEPGHYDGNPQLRAPGELATLGVGWALLHEVRHLKHQQEGDSADPYEEDPTQRRNEEMSCDAFATKFLLDQLDAYAQRENVSSNLVRRKRELGIYFALFAMTLLARDKWGASQTHPSIQARIDAIRALMGSQRDEVAEAIASVAFAMLHTLMPGSPGIFPSPDDARSSTHKKDFSGESILKEMPCVLEWLKEKGLSALNSRYSRYEKDVDNFFSCDDPTSADGRVKFDKLTNSYTECLNIVLIHRAFRDEASQGFVDRLSKVADGQDHPDASSAGSSRDFLFELLIAARMSLSGYKIDFNKITDVVAENNEFLVFSECKRLSSEKKFEENFKKAGKQITAQASAISQRVYGLVFLDVSSCLDGIPKMELPNVEAAQRAIHESLEAFVVRNASKIEQLAERFAESSLGVCLMGQAPIWTQDGTLYMAARTRVVAPKSLSDEDFNSLKKILGGFSSSMLCLV
ncbi:phage exclusion protein Lit family protein [Burkholderia gladioli]|uniref:phage exclusion protein Lit family protein n=1 Tax=Burkholderia gladioli TaxID=28095 RepID=UPI0016419BDA|nr:phage exclusion protein Lit family protein [Burkholderia gladioli]